jgi:hypothetical protein
VGGDGLPKLSEQSALAPHGTLKSPVARHTDHTILRSISPTIALGAIAAPGPAAEGWRFTLAEAYGVEAFEAQATQIVMPIARIDGPIGRQRQAWTGRQGAAAGFSPFCGIRMSVSRHILLIRVLPPTWACIGSCCAL